MNDRQEEPLLTPWIERYRSDPDYVAETMALDFAERVAEAMELQGLTRRALAEKMHVSPAYITRTLNAPPNLTLRTMAAFGIALGIRPSIKVETGLDVQEPISRQERLRPAPARPARQTNSTGKPRTSRAG
jgi:transcriptional regulator with XRE-family HTH domain